MRLHQESWYRHLATPLVTRHRIGLPGVLVRPQMGRVQDSTVVRGQFGKPRYVSCIQHHNQLAILGAVTRCGGPSADQPGVQVDARFW